MTLEEALAWADKNAQPEAVERLRSRAVAKTLADEVRRLQAKITWLEDQNEAPKDSFAIEGTKCDRLRKALEAFELLWAGADRSEWPSAWELWVCRPGKNQGWVRYQLYETHQQAKNVLKRVVGAPLEFKIVPLYSAVTEDLPSNA